MIFKSFKKQLCVVVLVSFLFTNVMGINIAMARFEMPFFADIFQALETPEKEIENDDFERDLPYYDLVAVLVDSDIYQENKSFDGLGDEYDELNAMTNLERVLRYAEDVQNTLENTKVTVIEVKGTDSVLQIRDMLEKFYFDSEQSSLSGVILVGDIPLPVLTKDGNNFPSIFPYTDFADKAYLFNDQKKEFEQNKSVNNPKAEVWHGVIKPPAIGEEGRKLLAEYFDKNHLYHIGNKDFSEFDQKIFYADLNFEEKSQNKDLFGRYMNYVNNAEDLTYKRFNNKWLAELGADSNADLEELIDQPMDFDAMNAAMSAVPDIFTKEMIEKYHLPYNKLFGRFVSKVNDFIEYTGRWKNSSDTPVSLISKKDLFSRQYSRKANDILEEKIDEIVEDDLQAMIPIIKDVSLSGTIDKEVDGNKYDVEFRKTFLNFTRRLYEDDPDALYINGIPGDLVERAEQCSIYRGSSNEDSQLTEMNRLFDGQSFNMSTMAGFIVEPSSSEEIFAQTGGFFDYGARLRLVVSDSGAEKVRVFEPNNIILQIDGERITQQNSLWDIMKKKVAGQMISVLYAKTVGSMPGASVYVETGPVNVEVKGGKNSHVAAALGVNAVSLSDPEALELTNDKYDYGALVQNDSFSGLPAVLPGTHAEAFLKDGDLILKIDGKKITQYWTLANAISGKHISDIVDILRYRDGKAELVSDIALADLRDYSAGCDLQNSQGEKVKVCSSYAARIPVFSAGGGKVSNDPLKEADPTDCFSFRPYEFLYGTPVYVEADPINPTIQKVVGFAGPDLGYTEGFAKGQFGYARDSDSYLQDADRFYSDMLRGRNFWRDNDRNNDGVPDRIPEVKYPVLYDVIARYFQIAPLEFTNLDFTITLEEILSHYGIFDNKDNDSDYFDTNENGKIDQMIVNDKNENGIIEWKDPKIGALMPLPLDENGRYVGGYTDEFVGGDFGVDEFDEDVPQFAFPNDWEAFENEFLASGAEREFSTPPNIEGDAFLYLKLKPTIEKWIPSVIKHAEPTNATITAELKSSTAANLPIDSPRYISFLLKNQSSSEEVIYPNIFAAKDYGEFLGNVHETETRLNGLAALAGIEKNYSGTLMRLLEESIIKDTIEWQNMNIDDKHFYVLETYLNPEKDAYISEAKKGYEAMYLVSDGNLGSFDLAFNGAAPDVKNDLQFKETKKLSEEDLSKDSSENEDGCNIITCWFWELLENFRTSLTFSSGFQFEQACGLSDGVSDGDKNLYEIIAERNENDGADKTSRLELSVNKTALKADAQDVLEVTVYAYDSANAFVAADSSSKVELFVTNPPDKDPLSIISQNPVPLLNGKAVFKVRSSYDDLKANIYARTINKSSDLQSNSVPIKSTLAGLRLSTYVTMLEGNTIYAQSSESFLVIKNGKGEKIAELSKDGRIIWVDPRYRLSLKISSDEPLQIEIVEKETNAVSASLFAAFEDEVFVDDLSLSYEDHDAHGLRIKDLTPADSIKVTSVPQDCEEFVGGAYIFEGDEILGLITKDGRVFIDDSLRIELSTYPVFEIFGESGEKMFEVLMSPKVKDVSEFAFCPIAYAEDFSGQEEKDTDGDGLSDITEVIIGTSPLESDTDKDSFNDNVELQTGYNPLKQQGLLFADLTPEHEFFEDILNLYKNGILKGYADSTFKPDNKITREEFIKIDLGVACLDCVNLNTEKKTEILSEYNKNSAFPDANINSDLIYCIAEARNRGIVEGYKGEKNKGYFLPKNYISRAEAIKVILETSGIEGLDSDLEGAPWYAPYVLAAQKEGILPKGRFVEIDVFSSDDFVKYYASGPRTLQLWLESEITRGEFAYMASTVLNKFNCYENDSDSDGIPDSLEIYRFGTDPNSADSDADGVTDLEEIVYGPAYTKTVLNACDLILKKFSSIPLSSDFEDLDSGIYVIGDLSEDYVVEASDNPIDPDSEMTEVVEYTNEILADGESVLKVRAEILDDNGDLFETDNTSVVQFSLLTGDPHISIPHNKVKVTNGVAETEFVSKKISGFANIRAEISKKDLPSIEKELYVYPDEPTTIDIIPQSKTLRAGGVSKTPVEIILRDKNGNKTLDFPYTVTLDISEGDGKFDESLDEDSDTAGIQITSLSKPPVVDFTSGEKASEVLITASLDSLHAETKISVHEEIETKKPSVPAVLNAPTNIFAYASSDILYSGGDNTVSVYAELHDENGDFVEKHPDIPVTFKLTNLTSNFAEFLETPPNKFKGGEAEATLIGNDISGPLNVVIESPGLTPFAIPIQVKRKFSQKDVFDNKPNVLYASVLGSSFGDITQNDYLAGSFAFSGKTQAVTSLISEPKRHKVAANVYPNGKVMINDPANYYAKFAPASSKNSYNSVNVISTHDMRSLFEINMPKTSTYSFDILEGDLPAESDDGLYIKKNLDDPAITYKEMNGLSVLDDGNEVLHIYKNGNIEVLDNSFNVEYPRNLEDTEHFYLQLSKGITNFANLYFVSTDSPSVVLFQENASSSPLGSAVSLVPKTKLLNFTKNYSSYSTDSSFGYKVTDPSEVLEGSKSLEDALESEGVGFKGDNKHMLLFAAGNTVGESNKVSASEIDIVLGDPTVQLKTSNGSDFTNDLGNLIYQGDTSILDLVSIDFDSDGDKDLFVVYESGEINLLERIPTRTKFKDRGKFLKLTNGILSVVAADFDGDSDEDLFVSTKESCKKGETCMYLYRNKSGYFERENLEFDIDSKMYFMKAADIDNDSDIDVIGSDTGGKILAFYNDSGTFEPNVQEIGNLGINIDSDVNLASNVWIHYSGMAELSPERKFELTLSESASVSASDLDNLAAHFSSGANVTSAKASTEVKFNLLSQDPILASGSYKKSEDLNGGNVEVDDELRITLSIQNTSGNNLDNVFVNDNASDFYEMMEETLECSGCKIIGSGNMERPDVFSGLSIAPSATLKITYLAKVINVPKVRIELNNKFSDVPSDEFLDIRARPENNPTGQLIYYHTEPSKELSANGRVAYKLYKTPKSPSEPGPDPEEQTDVLAAATVAMNNRSADSDGDGLPNAWDDVPNEKPKSKGVADLANEKLDEMNKLADQVSAAVEGVIAALKCSGGCIPTPINYAFLVPGVNSLQQPQIPPIPYPIFALIPSLPFVATGPVPAYFRIYASPTLTGSLGMAFCAGPTVPPSVPGHFCVAVAPPSPLNALGVCDAFSDLASGVINEALSVAATVEQSVSSGYTTVQANGAQFGADVPSSNAEDASAFGGSLDLGNYSVSAKASTNIRIPPFPGVIVEWIDRQIEHVVDTLADLPDIYVLYPDMSYIGKEFYSSINGFSEMSSSLDFMAALNRFPLLQLESKEISLKIPMLTPPEIKKIENDWKQWKVDLENEIKRVAEIYSCGLVSYENGEFKKQEFGDSENQVICDKIFVDATSILRDVEKNLEAIDEWLRFPKKLLQWRNLETKYIRQIICYMDVIMRFFGGWTKKQQNRIESWFKAIEKIKKDIETWKAIIDLTLDYETSCDECKSDKFSTLEILLKLFMFIPAPPDIPLPKWPDIVLDFSKVQLGLKFIIPDLKFRPERIIIPPIPRIRLPDLPNIDINLPKGKIPLIPKPPAIPEFPDLPPIPLLTLPDIPKAPTIPPLPDFVLQFTVTLSKILKVLCLIKKGFVPVPEQALKTQIEALTQRSLKPLLPLDLGLAVKYPQISYSYVDQIKLSTIVDFRLDTSPLFEILEDLADVWNTTVEKGVKGFNDELKEYQKAADALLEPPKLPDIQIDLDLESSLNGTYDYFESLRQTVETFKQDNDVSGDELKLLAEVSEYMPADQIACDLPEEEVPLMKEKLLALSKDIKEHGFISKMLASNGDSLPESNPLAALSSPEMKNVVTNPAATSNKANLGIFILNPENGINQKLINYTEELSAPSQIRYLDFDKDSDDDIIFTMGGDIYLKENYKNAPAKTKHKSGVDSGSTVSDFVPAYPALNMFDSPYENNEYAETSFVPSNFSDLYGYEFVIKGHRGTKKVNMVKIENSLPFVYLNGSGYLSSSTRKVLDSGTSLAKASDTIHAILPSLLNLHFADGSTEQIELEKYETYKVLDNMVNGVQVEVFEGEIEIIDNEEKSDNQKLENGFLLLPGDEFVIESGKAIVKYPSGAETVVQKGEAFSLMELTNIETALVKLKLDNGNYYTKAYMFDKQGQRSTASKTVLLAPQICADRTPPFPVISDNEIDEIILKEFEIDGRNSFDTDSEIVDFGLDIDSDGEIDMHAPPNDPVFKLGPFDAPQTLNAKFVVKDAANNEATQSLLINISVPNLSLDSDVSEKGFVTGYIDSETADIPVKIVRKRDDGFEMIETQSASEKGEYFTDSDGTFRIEDLDLSEKLVLKNAAGDVIAELTPKLKLSDSYKYVAYPTPTRIEIQDESGDLLLTTFFAADPNVDVQIDDEDMTYESSSVFNMSGVHVKDLLPSDSIVISKISAKAEKFSGGIEVINENTDEKLALIDTSGNIYLLDNDASLSVRQTDPNEPFVFEIIYGNKSIVDVYIASEPGVIKKIPKIERKKIFNSASALKAELNKTDFEDVPRSHPQFKAISRLLDLSIIEGYQDENGISFKPEQNITRSEFAKIILKILCINPREKAYLAPSFFSDVEYISKNDPWYYPFVKESFFLGLITGYIGEMDKELGLAPFKPNNHITRAEATKIILEALDHLSILELPKDITHEEGEAWYDPYLRIAINLKPYEKSKDLLNAYYLLTATESIDPNKLLTRAEFAELSNRVLDIYNCFELDKDGVLDGNGNEDEQGEQGLDPLDADLDTDLDTDSLEAPDPDEILDTSGDLEEGMYIGLPECYACPCPATISNNSDILPYDTIFAIISNDDNSDIYSKSNEIQIRKVIKHVE